MTPKNFIYLRYFLGPVLLATAVILSLGANLMISGLEYLVAPTEKSINTNVVVSGNCASRVQINAQKSDAGATACVEPQQKTKNPPFGLLLLWGAIAMTVVSSFWNGFRRLKRLANGR